MDQKLATVKAHFPCRTARPGASSSNGHPTKTAEAIRLELAEAWGEMGAAWGVTPAIARVQAYLMARQEPLTEREVREALGPVAIAPPAWPSPRPSRGGSSSASRSRDASVGAGRPGRPISRSATTGSGSGGSSPSARSARAIRSSPCSRRRSARRRPPRPPTRATRELAALRDWLAAFLVFVRLFDRAVGLVPQVEPRELERSLQLLGRVPDATILRLFDLLGGLDDDDVLDLVETLSRLSPTRAPRDEADVGGRPHGRA